MLRGMRVAIAAAVLVLVGCVSRHQSKVLTADDELTCTRIADNEDSSGCWVLSSVGFLLLPPAGIIGWVYCSENDDRAYNQCVEAREMIVRDGASPEPERTHDAQTSRVRTRRMRHRYSPR